MTDLSNLATKHSLFVYATDAADRPVVRAIATESGAVYHQWSATDPTLMEKAHRFSRNMAEAAKASHGGKAASLKSAFAEPGAPKQAPAISYRAHAVPILRALGVAC